MPIDLKFPKIKKISTSFDEKLLADILNIPNVYFPNGHFEYPVSLNNEKVGNHLNSLFLFEPIAKQAQALDWITKDIELFCTNQNLNFNLIFAPNQASVVHVVKKLAKSLNVDYALLEYLPTGWFGDNIVYGSIKPGDKVLVLNGVSQQGRCVGLRLPSIVKNFKASVEAASVFATGNGAGVKEAIHSFGPKLYRTLELELESFTPANCPICQADKNSQPVPWTNYRDLVIN